MIFNKVIASTAVDDFLGQLGYTELRGKMKNLLCSPASLAPLCKTRLSHMWSTLAIIVSSTSSRRRWRRLHNWQWPSIFASFRWNVHGDGPPSVACTVFQVQEQWCLKWHDGSWVKQSCTTIYTL
jgi:hypothetical protein